MIKQGTALQHMGYQLLEWGSLLEDIHSSKGKFHRFADQPCPQAFQTMINASSKRASREAFEKYLVESLAGRKRPQQAAANNVDFDLASYPS